MSQKNKDCRPDWEARYAASAQLFGTEPSELLRALTPYYTSGMTALALGDGEGRNGLWLAQRGLEVLSIDLSATALSRSRERARTLGLHIETCCHDLLQWDWPAATFDLITLIFVHLPPPARQQIHSAIIRALKPGGIVAIEAFHKDQLQQNSGGPQVPELLYDCPLLQRDFASLSVIRLEKRSTRVLMNGIDQGSGTVVHFAARKTTALLI